MSIKENHIKFYSVIPVISKAMNNEHLRTDRFDKKCHRDTRVAFYISGIENKKHFCMCLKKITKLLEKWCGRKSTQQAVNILSSWFWIKEWLTAETYPIVVEWSDSWSPENWFQIQYVQKTSTRSASFFEKKNKLFSLLWHEWFDTKLEFGVWFNRMKTFHRLLQAQFQTCGASWWEPTCFQY